MSRTDVAIMTEYPDTGCEVAPRCLECPLPVCIEEIRSSGPARKVTPHDIKILDAHRRGLTVDNIAKLYRVSGARLSERRRSVFRGIARARLYERAVGLSPRPLVREDAFRGVDVRVRLHLPTPPKPKRKKVIHARDWHDRLVILRAWGYSLTMIGYAAGRLDHSSVLHHLREECKCGQEGAWANGKVDVGREVAA